MTTPFDIDYYIGQIHKLDEWLKTVPMTDEYRERTTYREFNALRQAKAVELGLTPEITAQLDKIRDNDDLDMAWLEVGMTEDHRELAYEIYYEDLPLSYRTMPEYQPMLKALDDFMATQPLYQSTEDEALLEIVRRHMPEVPG